MPCGHNRRRRLATRRWGAKRVWAAAAALTMIEQPQCLLHLHFFNALMFSAKPKTTRPTGKAGRYESSQRGLSPSDNSPKKVYQQPESAAGELLGWAGNP